MSQIENRLPIYLVAFLALLILAFFYDSGEDQRLTTEAELSTIRREAQMAKDLADSLQMVIDHRELQIQTIYETLDHIPDYVNGLGRAERDSLRAILNPPW